MRFGRLTVMPWAPLLPPSEPTDADAPRDEALAAGPLTGEVRSSADGRTVVVVATYLDGDVPDVWRANPVVVRVYIDGALVTVRRLADVAGRGDLFESLGQVRWTRNVGLPRGATCLIETRRGAAIQISLDTGAVRAAAPHARARALEIPPRGQP